MSLICDNLFIPFLLSSSYRADSIMVVHHPSKVIAWVRIPVGAYCFILRVLISLDCLHAVEWVPTTTVGDTQSAHSNSYIPFLSSYFKTRCFVMKEVRRIGALSFGKINAMLGLLLGLIISVFELVVFGAMGVLDVSSVAFVVILPICYAIAGFVFGLIWASLYNVVVKWVGGVELDIK